MKKLPSIKALVAIMTILFVHILTTDKIDGNKTIYNSEVYHMNASAPESKLLNKKVVTNELLALNEDKREVVTPIEVPKVVYNGMTMEELGDKLEKSLKSTLKGYGNVFAEYSIKYEVDPYLALAIVLHETGCSSGKCSTLVRQCYNIGGMKGKPGCGGSYKRFQSMDEGIKAFYKNLSKNYYQKGLTTPESIGKKYAESESWPSRIRYYMNIIAKG